MHRRLPFRALPRLAIRLSIGLSLGLVVVAGHAGPALAGPYDDPGHDPAAMASWATAVSSLVRGPRDVNDPGSLPADFGDPANALGPSLDDGDDVVSLGDGGTITLFFAAGIGDGPGDDFAVFENGFYFWGGLFAEFAFVEVSSNGIDFAAFDPTCLQTQPVGTFDGIDPTDYDNLAGDQPLQVGTGFDLAELWGDALVTAGLLDLDDVRYVRLTDVIGEGSTVDGGGSAIYDPYATDFASGGFDVEAVGVRHEAPEPSGWVALATGSLGLFAVARRRGSPRCAQSG